MRQGASLHNIQLPTPLQATDVAAKYKLSAVGLDLVGYGYWTMLPVEIGILLWRGMQRADILGQQYLAEVPIPIDLAIFIPKI